MNKIVLVALLSAGLVLVQSSEDAQGSVHGPEEDHSALVQEQANQDYEHHQRQIAKQEHGGQGADGGNRNYQFDFNSDGSLGFKFDNKDHDDASRDRGYGFEKAYAYSRETTFLDFLADRPVLNAKDLVENEGKVQYAGANKVHGGGSYGQSAGDYDLDATEQKYGQSR